MIITEIIDKEYIDSILEKYPFDLGSGKISDGSYELKCNYAGEIRFGPPYFEVQLLENNVKVWANSIYGGELFRENIFSLKHNKLVLVKWQSLSPNDQTIVLVDLSSRNETKISKKGRYFFAGHFNSFNGIFYSESGISDIICKDLETNETFLINETINKYINETISWGISPIDNTILVLSNDSNRLKINLFDIKKNKKIDEEEFEFKASPNSRFKFFLDKVEKKSLLEISDYDLLNDRKIVNERKNYKLIEF